MKKQLFATIILIQISIWTMAETNLKLNAVYALGGVLNPAVEVGVAKNFTIQVEVAAAFYESITLSEKIKDMPLKFCLGFVEMHWFPKNRFNGFYCGPSIGYGAYRLQKWNYWGTTKIQNGTSLFLGAIVGWQWTVKRWTFDLFLGGGWQYGTYEGYDTSKNERYDIGTFPGKYNKSAEWMPFKGGLMIGYLF